MFETIRKVLIQIMGVILWLIAAIMPILVSPLFREPYDLPKTIVLTIVLSVYTVLFCIYSLIEGKVYIPRTRVLWAGAVFLFFTILSTVFSIHPITSLLGNSWRFDSGLIAMLLCAGVIISVPTLNSQIGERVMRIGLLYALSVGYVLTLLVSRTLPHMIWDTGRYMGLMGQPNYFAQYVLLIIPILVYGVYVKAHHGVLRVGSGVLLISTLPALLATQSRVAIAIGLLTYTFLAGYVVWGVLRKRSQYRTNIYIGLAGLLIIVTGLLTPRLFSGRLNLQLFSEITSDQGYYQGSGSLRYFAWKGALSIAQNNPLLGTGPDTFIYTYPGVKDARQNLHIDWEHVFDRAHNEYLDLAANMGLPATVAYVLFFILLLVHLYRGRAESWHVCLALAIGGYLLFNTFNFATLTNRFYFSLLVGLALASFDLQVYDIRSHLRHFAIHAAAVLLGIFALGSGFLFNQLRIAERATINGDAATAVVSAPFVDHYMSSYALRLMMTGRHSEAIQTQRTALTINPRRPENSSLLAMLLSDNDPEKLALLEQAGRLDPTNPRLKYDLAQYFLSRGERDKASASIEEALALKPGYEPALQLKEQLR